MGKQPEQTNLSVPEDVLEKTTRCRHGFSCLSTGKCGGLLLCEIVRHFDDNMLIVKVSGDKKNEACPYKVTCTDKDEHVCTCPTHYSLFLLQSEAKPEK